MSIHQLRLEELENEVRSGKLLYLVEPVFDSKQNLLIGTEKVLTEKDLLRYRERCADVLFRPLRVKVAIPHYIDEDKRVKWTAYVISLFEGGEPFKNMQRQRKDFVTKYLKSNLIENDYVIWKLSQLKGLGKKVFEHSLNTCYIAMSLYHTYTSLNQSGMIDALFVDDIIAAALIHPIGLLKFDPKMLEKKRVEYAESRTSEFYNHPLEGFKTVKAESGKHELSDTVLNAIMNQEEYIDGSGVPRGIDGKDFSFLDKLLCISNYFELQISHEMSIKPRPYKDYIAKLRSDKAKFDPLLIESMDVTFKHLVQP